MQQLFAKKSLETLYAEMEGEQRLKRVLGPISLTALGVGAIIGAGIFVMTGRAAAQDAGPAIMVSYCVAGLGCALAAFCYAEFAALAPVAGSAYTYAYATLGEIFAWIIGWDLILEYAMSCACVASAWSNYFNAFLKVLFGVTVPDAFSQDPFTAAGPALATNYPIVAIMVVLGLAAVSIALHGASHRFTVLHTILVAGALVAAGFLGKMYLNLPNSANLVAVAIMSVVTTILVIGIRESATANAILTCIKLGVVLFVIALGYTYVNKANWTSVPLTDRQSPIESKVIPRLVFDYFVEQQELKDKAANLKDKFDAAEVKARYDAAEANTKTYSPMVRAVYRNERLTDELARMEKLGKFTPDETKAILSADRAKQQPLLAKTPADEAVVKEIMNVVRLKAPEEEQKSWGLLGKVGLNEKLAAVDDRVRSNFFPFGFSGVMLGAAIVFFAFIGFDSISAHSEEAKVPQRDVPIGIIASLVICSILYLAVSGVITGMVPYPEIDTKAAIASAFSTRAKTDSNPMLNYASALISTGALAGLTSVLLITFLSQARIFLAMARDGFLPPSIFGKVHPVLKTPHVSTIFTGIIIAIVAAFTPIDKLEEMVNIGTLFAFVVVCAAVLVLRIKRPDAKRPFRCPVVWLVAPLGIFVNVTMMLFLPVDTWIRLLVWLGIGLVIYFAYGMSRSVHGRGVPAPAV